MKGALTDKIAKALREGRLVRKAAPYVWLCLGLSFLVRLWCRTRKTECSFTRRPTATCRNRTCTSMTFGDTVPDCDDRGGTRREDRRVRRDGLSRGCRGIPEGEGVRRRRTRGGTCRGSDRGTNQKCNRRSDLLLQVNCRGNLI